MTENSKNENSGSEANLNFKVRLDKQRTPASISWEADEADSPAQKACKAILISIWDPEKKNTIGFDLWTKDMMHDEMNTFVFQSMLMLGETYSKATGNSELAMEIQKFAENFAVKSKVLKPNEDENKRQPFQLEI